MHVLRVVGATFAALIPIAACGAQTSRSGDGGCTPNAEESCHCPSGEQGFHRCDSSGDAWLDCQCSGGNDGGEGAVGTGGTSSGGSSTGTGGASAGSGAGGASAGSPAGGGGSGAGEGGAAGSAGSSTGGTGGGAPPDRIPPRVSVAETRNVGLGFFRTDRVVAWDIEDVGPFQIMRFPVTIADFTACVESAACDEPRTDCMTSNSVIGRPNWATGDIAHPVTCAGLRQAEQYCAWIGGTLPTLSQWFLAARGPTVVPYSWGSAEPSCELHPGPPMCSQMLANFRVGLHPLGASPSGVEDVMLTDGELVQRWICTNPISSCNPSQFDGSYDGCVVTGSLENDGWIGWLAPVYYEPEPLTVGYSHGFRCVWEG